MLHKTLTLLHSCGGKINATGEPVKAIGYYSQDTNDRLNTISIHTIDFTGRIYLYGTLKLNPTKDSDWGIIPIGKDTDYIEFDNLKRIRKVDRQSVSVNVKGAYTWLKVKMDRSYIPVFKKPLPNVYTPEFVLDGINVMSDESIPMNLHKRKIPENTRIAPDTLRYYGNVEKVLLCY